MLSPAERKLLEKLADAGKPTELGAEDLILGKILEDRGLLLVVRNSAMAVITPRGRQALSGAPAPGPGKSRRSDSSARRRDSSRRSSNIQMAGAVS